MRALHNMSYLQREQLRLRLLLQLLLLLRLRRAQRLRLRLQTWLRSCSNLFSSSLQGSCWSRLMRDMTTAFGSRTTPVNLKLFLLPSRPMICRCSLQCRLCRVPITRSLSSFVEQNSWKSCSWLLPSLSATFRGFRGTLRSLKFFRAMPAHGRNNGFSLVIDSEGGTREASSARTNSRGGQTGLPLPSGLRTVISCEPSTCSSEYIDSHTPR